MAEGEDMHLHETYEAQPVEVISEDGAALKVSVSDISPAAQDAIDVAIRESRIRIVRRLKSLAARRKERRQRRT